MHYICYTLVVNNFASYKDIRDEYDIYEILDLYEALVISMHNRFQAMKGDER